MRSQSLLVEPLEIGRLASGEAVFDWYEHHSAIGENVLRLILKDIKFPVGQGHLQEIINLPVNLGPAQVVSTKGIPDSRICYAKRYGQYHHSRFVLDVSPPHLNTVVIQLRRDRVDPNGCLLEGVFIAKDLCHDIFDLKADVNAHRFWQEHAFVFGEVALDLDTVVSTPPYLPF
jgi:hypothetical protein